MSLRSRLHRLERERPDRGRCLLCRDRPKWVLKTYHQPSLNAAPVPRNRGEDNCEPCPGCGWTPEVTEITEVVVSGRDELRQLREREAIGQE